MNIYLQFLLVFIFCNNIVQSQQPSLINFNPDYGLPSSETYDLLQDKKGHIWIASDQGLSMFNGFESINYNESNNAPFSVVFNIFKESNSKIWISTKKNELYYFNPLSSIIKFHPFKFNQILTSHFDIVDKYNIDEIRNFQINNENYIITTSINPGYICIDSHGKVTSYQTIDSLKELEFRERKYNLNKNIKISNENQKLVYSELNSSNKSIRTIEYNDSIFIIGNEFDYHKNRHSIDEFIWEDEILILISYRDLIVIQNGIIKSVELTHHAHSIAYDKTRSEIFVGSSNGVLIYDLNLNHKSSFLKDNTITSIIKSNSDGWWFSTLNNGIYFSKNNNIKELSIKPPYRLLITKDFLIPYYADFTIELYQRSTFRFINKFEKVYYKKNRAFITYSNELLNYITNSIKILDDGSNYYRLDIFDYKKHPPIKYNGRLILDHDLDHVIIDSTIFYMSKKGLLFSNDNKTFSRYNTNNKSEFNAPGKKIALINNKVIYATTNNGIIIFDNSNELKINKSNGLLSQRITDLTVENDSTFWVGGFNGVYQIIIDNNLSDFKIKNINQEMGLKSNEVNDLVFLNDTLWVCTKKGVNYFNSSTEFKIKNKYFFLDSLTSNKNRLDTLGNKDTFELKYGDNLNIYFSIIKFDRGRHPIFEYSIANAYDTTWHPTDAQEINILNLTYNNYNLLIRDKATKKEVYSSNIIVAKPFWLLWYFQFFTAILIAGIIWLIVKYFTSINQRKSEKLLKNLQLEIRVLLSQMNPHFTFNTINSIQHYLIKNDKSGGIKYLNDYAKLMRISLSHSRLEIISLESEINFLKLYCELEKKRFDNNLTTNFIIKTENELSQIFIPPFMLQPLIENSIIHGVNSVDYDGEITIEIIERKGLLNLKIKDNGPGLLNNRKSADNTSHGLAIFKERLEIYNSQLGLPTSPTISYLDNNLNTGTIIHFKLFISSNRTSKL